MKKHPLLSGKPINTQKLKKGLRVSDLIENYYQAYNSARLQEACQLLVQKMLNPKNDVTIGLTLAGALTPAGMSGMIVSMMEKGFVDFIISTGANLYHDLHFALANPLSGLFKGTFNADDVLLDKHHIFRIYDIFGDTQLLLKTDQYSQKIVLDKKAPRGEIASSVWHNYFGRCLLRDAPSAHLSILAQAARLDIPIYTSSPADSTMGMDLACYSKLLHPHDGIDVHINPSLDVIETTAIVYGAKKNGAIILGGGSPKNFYMQTQSMLWEVLGIPEKGGHDYFIQITMDSPQRGGLSGATPQEAVSWGKIKPEEIKNTVVVYSDATLAAPLLFAYAFEKAKPRKPKQLFLKREKLVKKLQEKCQEKPMIWLPDYKPHPKK